MSITKQELGRLAGWVMRGAAMVRRRQILVRKAAARTMVDALALLWCGGRAAGGRRPLGHVDGCVDAMAPRMCQAAKALAPSCEFDDTVLAIQAAAQGLGVLVVPETFVAAMLRIDALRRHGTAIETGRHPVAYRRSRSCRRCIQWG